MLAGGTTPAERTAQRAAHARLRAERVVTQQLRSELRELRLTQQRRSELRELLWPCESNREVARHPPHTPACHPPRASVASSKEGGWGGTAAAAPVARVSRTDDATGAAHRARAGVSGCQEEGCAKPAQGDTQYCIAHGAGGAALVEEETTPRCSVRGVAALEACGSREARPSLQLLAGCECPWVPHAGPPLTRFGRIAAALLCR